MKKIDHYRKLLGVTKEADLKELKSVYRNQMKEWHPDKFQEKEDAEKERETIMHDGWLEDKIGFLNNEYITLLQVNI